MFYGAPSEYLLEDSGGATHRIPKAKAAKKAAPTRPCSSPWVSTLRLRKPALSCGQGNASLLILTISTWLQCLSVLGPCTPSWKNNCALKPQSGSTVARQRCGIVQESGPKFGMFLSALHGSRTLELWCGGGGSGVPSDQQGMKVLGTPSGHVDFVTQHLQSVTDEQRCLLERIPLMKDLQSVWLLLLHCASARANYQIRAVCPAAVELYAQTHDENIWQCLGRILHIDPAQCSNEVRESATLALSLGGFGPQKRRPNASACFLGKLGRLSSNNYFGETCSSGRPIDQPTSHTHLESCHSVHQFTGVREFVPSSWRALAHGARPETREPDQFEFGKSRDGWQHEVASRVEESFRMFSSPE